LINNRQAGRRRGRGGQQQRPQGNTGRQDNGNRIDNRARGNAAQLLEKYKTLARDAQMQGDRVNTEYYLQFADHYFRVLAETRSRFEENRRQNGGAAFEEDDQEYDEDGEPIAREPVREARPSNGNGQDRGQDRAQERGNEGQNGNQAAQYDEERPRSRNNNGNSDRGERNGNSYADNGNGNGRYAREDRNGNERNGGERSGNDRNDRNDRANRGEDRGNRATYATEEDVRQETPRQETPRQEAPRQEAPRAEVAAEQPAERPRRGRPPRRPVEDEAPAMFEANLLPPSLSISAVTVEEEPAEKPKRRRGRPPASETTTAG